MVPGQHATSRGAAGARSPLGVAPAPPDRDRLLYHRAPMAHVPAHRGRRVSLRSVRTAGLFPVAFLVVPGLARAGPDPGGLGVGATMAVLLVPKLLAYLVMLTRPSERRGSGGA